MSPRKIVKPTPRLDGASPVPRYKRKGGSIEAQQFATTEDDGENLDVIVTWIRSQTGVSHHNGTNLFLLTVNSVMKADVGDWIVRGLDGQFYICKADVFDMTYEPV